MRPNLTVALALAAISCVAPSLQAQEADAAKLAAQVCASCHGPRGDSISPAFPKLAAQRPEYLENQLKAFRDRTRADPMAQAYMWGMTSQLGDEAILQGFPEALDAALGLGRVGADVADAEVAENLAELGRVLGALELFLEGPVRVIADEDAEAIAVEGDGQPVARGEPPEQGEIAVEILRGPEVQG